MIEPILDYREYAVPKLIKKEFLYRKIQKRVWPLSLELKLFEGVYIDSQKNLRVPVPIPHAQARKVDFYVSAQQLSARKAKAGEQFKTKRERERDLINELRTDTQANMQVLLDRNGREMQIESDDNEADDDSEQELANERRLKAKLEGVKSKKTAARVPPPHAGADTQREEKKRPGQRASRGCCQRQEAGPGRCQEGRDHKALRRLRSEREQELRTREPETEPLESRRRQGHRGA